MQHVALNLLEVPTSSYQLIILSIAVAKKVAGWAANHYLVSAEKPEVRNSKLVISAAR